MDYTLAHPRVIEQLVAAMMSSDGQSAQLGHYLDELSRHHPPLRPLVLKATLEQIRLASEDGAQFQPDEEDRQRYLLNAADTAGEFDKPVENRALNKLLNIFSVRNTNHVIIEFR